MANIKDLKKKIKSTKSTHKITKAMKLVSAAKLARAQARIVGLKAYSEELQQTVKKVTAIVKDYEHSLLKETPGEKSLILTICSDKGLCGGYNSGLVKQLRNFIKANSHLTLDTIFIGKKAREILSKEMNVGELLKFKKSEPTLEELRVVAIKIAEKFKLGKISKLYLAYNTFFSAMNYKPVIKQILPFALTEKEKAEMADSLIEYKFEPSAADILDVLIPEVYFNSINTALFDALASEHGARMVAMENASKNCSEVIRKITLKANKLRQAAITTELIEVVSGAESLKA